MSIEHFTHLFQATAPISFVRHCTLMHHASCVIIHTPRKIEILWLHRLKGRYKCRNGRLHSRPSTFSVFWPSYLSFYHSDFLDSKCPVVQRCYPSCIWPSQIGSNGPVKSSEKHTTEHYISTWRSSVTSLASTRGIMSEHYVGKGALGIHMSSYAIITKNTLALLKSSRWSPVTPKQSTA